MNAKIIEVILILVANLKICQSRSYNNYTLIKLVPQSKEDIQFLYNLETQKTLDIHFWQRPIKVYREVHIIINPVDFLLFQDWARNHKLEYKIIQSNIQRAFDKQKVGSYKNLRTNTFLLNHYHTLDDINQWMLDLVEEHSKFVRQETVGRSVEGKNIYALSINRNNVSEKVIVDGGIHGHEWMSVAFVTYLINALINSEESDDTVFRRLVNSFHWLLIPVVNPDGYVYTHETDRLWRKNRRNVGNGIGVDLNRNFDHAFGRFASSRDPNDDFYCGEKPFSEPESKALSSFIQNHKYKLRYYFSFHSYGQKIVIPYEDRIQHIENYSEMENYARQAVQKIYRLNGMKYSTGTSYDTSGTRESGTSTSWAKKNFRIPYVFAIYLRDNGTYGFALTSDQIIPTCNETMVALITLMTARPKYIRSLYGIAPPADANVYVVFLGFFVVLQ